MKNRSSRRGCLFGGLGLLFLLLGGGWWFYQSRSLSFDGAVLSPVVVTITSPASGDEMSAGDFVPFSAQALSPDAIQSVELFLDGQSLGKLTDPANAHWTWQAWPLGIHSFYAQATDSKGQTGYSQVVIVNVLTGDGEMDVFAEEGQTLEQIGAGYGVPPDQMTGSNPILPPSQPLPGGQPVQVPVNNIEPPNLPPGDQISIKWKIKFIEKVDKAYCYVSTGNGVWQKIPKDPFSYFYGQENFYTQLIPYKAQANIQMQCWGWVGGTLKYLGQAEKALDPSKAQGEITISTTAFIFTGFFKVPISDPLKTLGGNGTVPPPFALRESADVKDCASHGDPLITPLLCNGVLSANPKQNLSLIWEWQPETCFPGYCKYGVDKIAGYGVYEIDPAKQTTALIADIKSSALRVAFPPIPWAGGKCFGVEAYVDYPGSQVSAMDTYCPGTQPSAKMKFVSLTDVTQWVTSDDTLDTAGCKLKFQQNYLPGGAPLTPDGWGNKPGEVHVGSHHFDSSGGILAGTSCEIHGYYNAGLKFNLGNIPQEAVIQKAILRFFVARQSYFDGLFSGKPPGGTCISAVGRAKSDWNGLVDADHWTTSLLGQYADYNTTGGSVKLNPSPQADVTSIVKDWLANPSSNHGFLLWPVNPPPLYEDEHGVYCESSLGSFKLDVYYFAQP